MGVFDNEMVERQLAMPADGAVTDVTVRVFSEFDSELILQLESPEGLIGLLCSPTAGGALPWWRLEGWSVTASVLTLSVADGIVELADSAGLTVTLRCLAPKVVAP